NHQTHIHRAYPGFWILLLAATSGGVLLFATMLSTRLPAELACALPGVCTSGSALEAGIQGFVSRFSLPMDILPWVFILIPTLYAVWYFRRNTRMIIVLSISLVLFSVVLWIRQFGTGNELSVYSRGAGLGLALAGQSILIVMVGWTAFYDRQVRPAISARRTKLYRLNLAALVAVTVTLLSGAFLAMGPAAEGCLAGPLCNLAGIAQGGIGVVHLGHWAAVGAAGLLILWLTYEAWRSYSHNTGLLVPITALAVLFLAQAIIGGIAGLRPGAQPALDGLHSLASTGVWCLAIFTTFQVVKHPRPEPNSSHVDLTSGSRSKKDYLLLMKPIIVALLLVTTYAGMVLAGGKLPAASLTIWTLVAGALAAGGSSAINQYIDRDRDRLMVRTANRPIASRRLTPAEGLAFGVGLCLGSFFLMAVFVNILAAVLSLAGIIYYVYLYSILLKNATVQNIVIGGGAGAIPPLVGWAAVSGNLTIAALMLFVVIFMWRPPHFWALALVRRKDYARAGVPMLPVVRGEVETRRQVFVYTIILVAITLTLPFFELGGAVYLAGAALLGIWLIHAAWKVLKVGGNKVAWKMYRYSSMYLAFLFLALVVDSLLA
ncbi:MAG: heme o synthase, partial [Anaerolineales bacterium]|nr:heme o synthase [Anaerolineales bacterium]